MGKMITLRLNNFLYNAGIVGFIRVLKEMEEDFLSPSYHYENNQLTFDSSILEQFTEYYIKTLFTYYKKDSRYQGILNAYEIYLKEPKENLSEEHKVYKSFINQLKTFVLSGKIKPGYEIIKKRGDNQDIIFAMKKVIGPEKEKEDKKEKEEEKQIIPVIPFEEKLVCIEEIMNYLIRHEEILLMKDIAYTILSMYWKNKAFFKDIKGEPKESYEETFIKPFLLELEKEEEREEKYACIECNRPVETLSGRSMGWLNDMGVDIARKPSNFWNFNPDIVICPICSLIYSCSPLGFYNVGQTGLFINSSTSVSSLLELNNHDIKLDTSINHENLNYYKIIRGLHYFTNVETAKKRVDFNLQIITRKKQEKDFSYQINILTPFTLNLFLERETEFKRLTKQYFAFEKESKKISNVYDKIMVFVMKNRNLLPFISEVLRIGRETGQKIDFLDDVLKIQINMLVRGERDQMKKLEKIESLEKTSKHFFITAREIKEIIKRKRGKYYKTVLNKYDYHLGLRMKTNNMREFSNEVIKIFKEAEKEIPISFLKLLNKEEDSKIFAQAFRMGLQSELFYDSKNKETKKEEISKV